MSQEETALAFMDPEIDLVSSQKAPIESSGDNVYVVWFTDRNTSNTNSEVIFRASNDSGATFGDKINLSNTSDTDSINPEIETVADNTVVVTWWERANAMSNEPVMTVARHLVHCLNSQLMKLSIAMVMLKRLVVPMVAAD